MVDIDKFCSDAQALIGKASYTDRSKGESQCTDYNKLMTGKYTTQCAGYVLAVCKHNGFSCYNGTNTMWRTNLTESGYITDGKPSQTYPHKQNGLKSSQLQKGMVVFKWESSGEPSKYQKDGKGNYCHVGIVTSVKPLHICHSTSVKGAGITMDKVIGKWCAWGKLKGMNFTQAQDTEPTEEPTEETQEAKGMYIIKVKTRGGSLNIRELPTTSSKKIGSLKNGKVVNATALENGWYKLQDGGYASADYFEVKEVNDDVDDPTDDPTDEGMIDDEADPTSVQYRLAELQQKVQLIFERLGLD